jgi:fluoride exporter
MPFSIINLMCVALAGAAGAVARWGTAHFVDAVVGKNWPWGTFAVNVLGCFIFGFGYQIFFVRGVPSDSPLRLLLFTGFLGAYTTFSTFAFDTYEIHARTSESYAGIIWALINVLSQVIFGIAAVVIGIQLAKLIAASSS